MRNKSNKYEVFFRMTDYYYKSIIKMRQILDIFKLLNTMINWQMIVWLYLIIPNERVLHLGTKKYDIKKEV